MNEEFVAERPSTPIGREIFNRGVGATLQEAADTLNQFLIPTPPGREPCDDAWIGFTERLQALANEAKRIEASTPKVA